MILDRLVIVRLAELPVVGQAVADALLFNVAVAAVFLAADLCPKRLSSTNSSRRLRSPGSSTARRELRSGIGGVRGFAL